jgi:hypothetical protein
MVQVKDLTEVRVRDLWREVKDEEDWWGDLKEESLRVVRRLMESVMEEELLEQLRAGRHRRSGLRRGYRNGRRQRSILTELGLLESFPGRVGAPGPGWTLPAQRPASLPAAPGGGEPAGTGDVFVRGEHPEGTGGGGASIGSRGQCPKGVPDHPEPGCPGEVLAPASLGRPLLLPAVGWDHPEGEGS